MNESTSIELKDLKTEHSLISIEVPSSLIQNYELNTNIGVRYINEATQLFVYRCKKDSMKIDCPYMLIGGKSSELIDLFEQIVTFELQTLA